MKELISVKLIEQDNGELVIDCDPDEAIAADFDLLIRALGGARQGMQPPVSMAVPSDGNDIAVVPGPGWFVGDHFPMGKVLGLRHPMFGWLMFQVPDNFPALLQEALGAIPQQPRGPAH